MKIAIIGTAGRKDDADRLDRGAYLWMCDAVRKIIDVELGLGRSTVDLISGGAAYAVHVAVTLFLNREVNSLHLALPCAWDVEKQTYRDSGVFDWRTNPGGTSNHLHRAFSAKVYPSIHNASLNEIDLAIGLGASTGTGNGFFDRNLYIANQADVVIAFTFGNGAVLKDGGTADTVGKYEASCKKQPRANPPTVFHGNLLEREVYRLKVLHPVESPSFVDSFYATD